MKILKNKIKVVLTIAITAILVGGLSVFATYKYIAKDITYIKKDGTEVSLENALNELYTNNIKNMQVITSAIGTTSSRNTIISSVRLNIPESLDCNRGILIVTRSSYWWDSSFADNITGDFESINEIYKNANGCNTQNAGTSTSIQARNRISNLFC